MVNEPAKHNPKRDALLISAWMGDRLGVSYSNFVLKGPRGSNVAITFGTFACLYATEPQYRVLSATDQPAQDVRRALISCRLPGNIDQMFRRSLVQGTTRVTVDEAWAMAHNASLRLHIPLGMVAFGRTPDGRECRVLYTQPTASPVRVLQRLQRYAASN